MKQTNILSGKGSLEVRQRKVLITQQAVDNRSALPFLTICLVQQVLTYMVKNLNQYGMALVLQVSRGAWAYREDLSLVQTTHGVRPPTGPPE